jgi:hypothetical protein
VHHECIVTCYPSPRGVDSWRWFGVDRKAWSGYNLSIVLRRGGECDGAPLANSISDLRDSYGMVIILPLAKQHGAQIFTQVEVDYLVKLPDGRHCFFGGLWETYVEYHIPQG